MILNDRGQVVWFHPVDVGPRAATKTTDLLIQRYQGRPVLTWWEDPLVAAGGTRREPRDVVFDQSYRPAAIVRAGNGFEAGLHAFIITSQGTALIEANRDIRCDLAGLGAAASASVWDNVIQEIDIKTGLVRWEWSSLEHVALDEAYDSAARSSANYPFDFFHLNSVQVLDRNDLLISARNTWAVYEIDRPTGAIRFRLGGKDSSFVMGPGTRTAYQHDARVVTMPGEAGDMLISMFDNGGTPEVHHESRALIEAVNMSSHTVKLLRSLTHSPPLLAPSREACKSWDAATALSAGARNRGSPNTTALALRSSMPTSRQRNSPIACFASTGTGDRPSRRSQPWLEPVEGNSRSMRAGTGPPVWRVGGCSPEARHAICSP